MMLLAGMPLEYKYEYGESSLYCSTYTPTSQPTSTVRMRRMGCLFLLMSIWQSTTVLWWSTYHRTTCLFSCLFV